MHAKETVFYVYLHCFIICCVVKNRDADVFLKGVGIVIDIVMILKVFDQANIRTLAEFKKRRLGGIDCLQIE